VSEQVGGTPLATSGEQVVGTPLATSGEQVGGTPLATSGEQVVGSADRTSGEPKRPKGLPLLIFGWEIAIQFIDTSSKININYTVSRYKLFHISYPRMHPANNSLKL